MSEVKKIALTLVVLLLMTLGVCAGLAWSTPTLTPGFGASGDWGFTGGETVIVNPPPVTPPINIVVPVPVNPPAIAPGPAIAPNLGASGDWGLTG